VLVGQLGSQGLRPGMIEQVDQIPRGAPLPAPYFLAESRDLNSWIKPVPGKPLAFTTVGQATNVTLVPFYRLFGERYAAYWHVFRPGSPEHKKRLKEEEARRQRLAWTVDTVVIGDPQSEHELKGEKTASRPFGDRAWRHAEPGGWFSYRLKVLGDRPMKLVCAYHGSDVPPRTFDILVDGQKIATQSLNRNKPGELFEVEYPIPADLTRSKRHIVVRFQPHPGNLAGGVFGLWILK
jgi:hypothetical protein